MILMCQGEEKSKVQCASTICIDSKKEDLVVNSIPGLPEQANKIICRELSSHMERFL